MIKPIMTILKKIEESAMEMPWKWHEIVGSYVWLKVPWICHESAMAEPWHFHGTLTATPKTWFQTFHAIFMADSWHFRPLQKCHAQVNHIHGTFMAPSRFNARKCHEYDLLEHGIFEVVESAMNPWWIWHSRESDMKVTRKCHESAMNLRWIWHSG